MSFDPSFLALMQQTAQYAPFTASGDGYGTPAFGPAVAFQCHITFKTKILRGNAEENAVSTAQIQLPPAGLVVNGVATPTISTQDQVTLPDGKTRRVLDVITYTDDTAGDHHQSVALT